MRLEAYRPWLVAAALYNLLAGALIVVAPGLYFNLLRMAAPNYLPLWQVVGMFMLVYAPGYWWASRHPARHSHLVLIGLLGKVLGPLGFAWSLWNGQLPLLFGAILISNDLIWWAPFVGFVRAAAGVAGGWRAYLKGGTPGVQDYPQAESNRRSGLERAVS